MSHSLYYVAWNDDEQEPTAVGTIDPRCAALCGEEGRQILTVMHDTDCACGLPPVITTQVPGPPKETRDA